MALRSWALVVTVGLFFVGSGRASAEDAPAPDLKPLSEAVRKVVEKHYPKCKVALKDQAISFEFNTRKFMVHEPLLTGEWQDAFEEVGPQKGGVMGGIVLRSGQYGGQAAVPQAFDKRYFVTLVLAPYSKKLDAHLYAHIKYPPGAPKEFVKELHELLDSFEKHVPAKGK